MDLLKNIAYFLNPFGTFIFLMLGIFILLFFGISKRNRVRNFIFILVLILLIGASFVNIYSYKINGEFSNDLFISGIFEVVLTAFILFFAVVCLCVIFIRSGKNDSFVRINIIFLFAVVSSLVLIISRSFMSFFIGLGCFLIAFFALTTVLNDSRSSLYNGNEKESKILFLQADISKSVIRFFISSLFFTILMFFGFSILYGVSDVRNFLQLLQNIETGGINIIFSLIIVSIACYIYLGIFPLQAPYINFVFKTELSSLYFLWLFYFPVGIAALLKFTPIILILNKNLKAGSYILYVLLTVIFMSSIGSGIAGLRTKSLRKISAYIFTLMLSGYFINMLMLITGFIKEDNLNWLNIFNLSIIAFCFLPIAFILSSIENISGKDSSKNLKSLIFKDRFIGIAFLISVFSLIGIPGFLGYLGKKYYFDLAISILNSEATGLAAIQGWLVLGIIIIYIAAFTAVNLRLVVILFMKESKETGTGSTMNFPKAFYVLIGFFILLILFLGIIGLLETLNPGINLLGIRITDSAIFIKNLK